jgi:hypothetical protein
VLERFAAWCALLGDESAARRGARGLGAAASLRHAAGRKNEPEASTDAGALPEAGTARAGCLSALGADEFARCWREGATLANPEGTLAEEATLDRH